MFKICKNQLLHSLSSPRLYVALLLGISVQIIALIPLLNLSEAVKSPINIWEPFVYFNCDDYIAATALLGVFLLVSDIPFTEISETYSLIRISRVKWLYGKTIYIIFMCVVYYVVIAISGMVFIIGNACISSNWSLPIHMLTQDTSLIIANRYTTFFLYPEITSSLLPIHAYFYSIILSAAYACICCLFLFLLNMFFSRSISFFLTIFLHIAGYTLSTIGVAKFLSPFSLFGNSLLMYHSFDGYSSKSAYLSIRQSLLVYFILTIVILKVLKWKLTVFDFKILGVDQK